MMRKSREIDENCDDERSRTKITSECGNGGGHVERSQWSRAASGVYLKTKVAPSISFIKLFHELPCDRF